MSKILALPLASLAALLALAPAEVAAQGFDLPPAPTPSPSSSPVYGPQDPDRPAARPIPVPTQRATPAARSTPMSQPSATATPTPSPQSPVVQSVPTSRQTTAARRPTEPANRPVTTERAPGTPGEPTSQPDAIGPTEIPTSLPAAPTTATAPPEPAGEAPTDSGLPWLLIVLVALVIALAGGAFAWWRRREGPAAVSVPQIERPAPVKRSPAATNPGPVQAATPAATVADPSKVAPLPSPPKPAAVAFDNGPLHVAFEVRDITATLMTVTLNYRITVSNRGRETLTELLVGGVMEAARGDVAIERQLEPPLGKLPAAHNSKNLEPGAVIELTGEFRVPLAQLNPIRRGEQALFVPIVRLRAAAASDGNDPVIAQQSTLLGRADQGPELVPIRLDQGPRVYRHIGQRLVAPQAA